MTMLKLFVHGFWGGFLERTDYCHVGFFLDLFQKVFSQEVECVDHLDDADILLESIFGNHSHLSTKKWRYTCLYSGESRLRPEHAQYDCVLYGESTHGNVIHCPEYLMYVHCTHLIPVLDAKSTGLRPSDFGRDVGEPTKEVLRSSEHPAPLSMRLPKKPILAIISNGGGGVRNAFLNALEPYVHIDYGGAYKNNIPRVEARYDSPEFYDVVRQYRCVIAMENSRGEHYVTEKITHGLVAGTVPIYWGSPRVHEHFHPERFVNLRDATQDDFDQAFRQVMRLLNDDDYYQDMVRKPIFPEGATTVTRTLDDVAQDLRARWNLQV